MQTESSFQSFDHKTETERVMVASFVDKPEEGQVFDRLPIHLTYVSWFDMPQTESASLLNLVDEIVEDNRAPKVVGGSLKLFTGKDGPAEVRRLDVPTADFNALHDFVAHAALVNFAKQAQPDFDDRHFGLAWSPHITNTAERAIQQGEELALNNLTVVSRDARLGRKVIQKVFEWGTSNG